MIDLGRDGLQFRPRRPWARDFVRIVSWNIERGLQFAKILEFLRTMQADVLLLQELDLNARRTGHRDVAHELARSLNLNYAFGMEFQELSQGTPNSPAYHGMATLTPWPISNARVIRFRNQSQFWSPRWYVPDLALFQRRIGGRIALVAEIAIYGRKVVTYNIHLESRGGDRLRLRQLQEVLDDSRGYIDRPEMVLAGDFNMNAGAAAAAPLSDARFYDALRMPEHPTSTAHGFHQPHTIDWIFVSDSHGFQGRVHNNIRASDHYPISATVKRCAGKFAGF